MVPVVHHQLQSCSPDGWRPSDMVKHSGVLLQISPLFNSFFFFFSQRSVFSKYEVPSVMALSSCFQMSNFEKCSLEHAPLYVLNTLHAYRCQWEIRDFLTFSLLSLHETRKKFSIETAIITCAQYILLCIIRIKLIDNDIMMNSLQDAAVQYLRKLVKSG